MNPEHLAARHAESTRRGNEMVQRELLEGQQFTAGGGVVDTDLREPQDPDVPYDPITEIDFLTQEEVEQIGDLE